MSKQHSSERIVVLLRQADVELGKGPRGSGRLQAVGHQRTDLLPLAQKLMRYRHSLAFS